MSRLYEALRLRTREHGIAPDRDYEIPSLEPECVPDSGGWGTLHWAELPEFVPVASPEEHLLALSDGRELGTEKFRILQARLRRASLTRKVQRVLVTSAVPEDGKSLVATNLAISLARHAAERVLLLEGDLHKPTLARKLGLPVDSGLAECLSDRGRLEEHCYHVKETSLWVLPAGHARCHPLGLLQSKAFQRLLAVITSSFEWILIDSPPLSPLADAAFWAEQADGVLLVVRAAHTPLELLESSIEDIDPAKLLGLVLNDWRPKEHTYYKDYYRSHSSSFGAVESGNKK